MPPPPTPQGGFLSKEVSSAAGWHGRGYRPSTDKSLRKHKGRPKGRARGCGCVYTHYRLTERYAVELCIRTVVGGLYKMYVQQEPGAGAFCAAPAAMQKSVLKSSTISKSNSAKKSCSPEAHEGVAFGRRLFVFFSRAARNNLITPGGPLPIKSEPYPSFFAAYRSSADTTVAMENMVDTEGENGWVPL